MTTDIHDQALDIRSIMFVPALAQPYIEKAHTRGADAIILDLEDSIPPEHKGGARGAVGNAIELISRHLPVYVRVNNTPEHLDADLEASVQMGLTGIMLPKAEDPGQVAAVADKLASLAGKAGISDPIALALLVETPAGLVAVNQLAKAADSVVALTFGSEDYSAVLGVKPSPEAMTVPAQLLTMAARGHGIAAWGVAGTIVEIADAELLSEVARASQQLGFTGTIAVNPKQIPIFNQAFGISSDDLAWAHETLKVFEAGIREGKAAVRHQGRMIDTPVAVRAQRILTRASKYSIVNHQ